MSLGSPLTRRHLIGALGAAGVAGASGLTFSGVAAGALPDDPNGGTPAQPSPSPAVDTRDLPNPVVLPLSAGEFHPLSDTDYEYVSPGGVRLANAPGTWFDADVKLPVGATITGAEAYLNPNGAPRLVQLVRYDPRVPTFENLVSQLSTSGTAIETVPLAVTHTVEAGWNYKFGQVRLDVGAAVLYGGRITYTIPPDPAAPTGVFVPFAGAARVYDSRTGAGKLAGGAERVIPLGVPGTVKAAVFNITVTETETAGFVACFKADIAWPGNSSVNWYEGGANTANLVICAVDATGAIKIRGGNDDTHVVIDLIGTFV